MILDQNFFLEIEENFSISTESQFCFRSIHPLQRKKKKEDGIPERERERKSENCSQDCLVPRVDEQFS